ncbi:MAG: ZIP family metal transporter [Planctomycetales bacterium]|nr:ZIP family metal transporter [Planctomycetales bacterium]
MPISADPHWQAFGLLLAYSAAVILASVLGGLLPEWIRLTHTRMQLMISFVGGVMLGIAVFHMVPHALATLGPGQIDQVMWGVMLGLLATFFLLRSFHFHQHGPADFGILAEEQAAAAGSGRRSAEGPTHLCCDHSHPSGPHGESHDHHTDSSSGHAGKTRWLAVLLGLGMHTLMDGVAMASGVVAEAGHAHGVLPGLGIFLAVLLHKPLDAVSITSLMYPVTTPGWRLLVNVGFALMCPLGALLFWSGASLGGGWSVSLAGWGLAFSAGVFLCISLSDLLPEMEFHSHSRIPLTVALLLGIAAAWAIGLLEGEHAHQHQADTHLEAATDGHDHSHDHSHPSPD